MSDVLSWPRDKFRRVFRAALEATSTDVAHRLRDVRVVRSTNVLTVVATSGHWLFRWRESSAGDDLEISVPRPVLVTFLRHVRTSDVTEARIVCSDGWWFATTPETVRLSFTPGDRNFPEYESVCLPPKPIGVGALGLGTGVWRRVARAVSLIATNTAIDADVAMRVRGTGGDKLAPLIVTHDSHPEFYAVVMPARIAEEAP